MPNRLVDHDAGLTGIEHHRLVTRSGVDRIQQLDGLLGRLPADLFRRSLSAEESRSHAPPRRRNTRAAIVSVGRGDHGDESDLGPSIRRQQALAVGNQGVLDVVSQRHAHLLDLRVIGLGGFVGLLQEAHSGAERTLCKGSFEVVDLQGVGPDLQRRNLHLAPFRGDRRSRARRLTHALQGEIARVPVARLLSLEHPDPHAEADPL